MSELVLDEYVVLLGEIKQRIRSGQYAAPMRNFCSTYRNKRKLSPLVREINMSNNRGLGDVNLFEGME